MRTRSTGYGRLRPLVYLGAVIIALFSALWLAGVPAAAAPPRPAAAHRPLLIWALGDSLTAGLGLAPADGFTSQLERALRRAGVPATVKNGGISGDTAAQAAARLRWGLRGLGNPPGPGPDLVIVELGANDMLRGLPPRQAAQHLDAILAELARRHIPVLLAGMKAAPNMGPEYRRAFDAMYPALAARWHVPLYPFFLDGVAGRRGLIQADGMHPNAQGVAIVVARILPAVRHALAERR